MDNLVSGQVILFCIYVDKKSMLDAFCTSRRNADQLDAYVHLSVPFSAINVSVCRVPFTGERPRRCAHVRYLGLESA
jgi:hypothetical protein